jgi:hypothetical protein
MGKRGPKAKPEGERYVTKSFKFPPELWAEVEEHIPKGQRSRLVQECLQRAAARARKKPATP